MSEIDRPESSFQNRTGDEHFSTAQESPVCLLLSYRRLPLYENCPPFIKQFLDATDPSVPSALQEALYSCTNGEELASVVLQVVGRLWDTYSGRPADADARWSCIGFTQWAGGPVHG